MNIPGIKPTPLQKVEDIVTAAAGVHLYIKRDDLICPDISGNKWRKVKYNLLEARRQGKDTLLSFGGAFSNHIHALAAAGREFGFRTVGVIRGKDASPENPTLRDAVAWGMRLEFVDREDYRRKEEEDFLQQWREKYMDPYIIPEGGKSLQAIKGCAEIVSETDIDFDYICCACGTGTTLAGLVAGLEGRKKVLGFSALKGDFLTGDVKELLREWGMDYENWKIFTDYHFGGYAKINSELERSVLDFNANHNIIYEPIYTGKMLYGLYDLIRKGYFGRGETIVAVHTGGLQGLRSLKLKA